MQSLPKIMPAEAIPSDATPPAWKPSGLRAGIAGDAQLRRLSDVLVLPIAAGVCVALLAEVPYEGSLVTALVFLCSGFLVAPRPSWVSLLPFMRFPLRAIWAVVGVAGVAVAQSVTGLPGLRSGDLLVLLGVTAMTAAVSTAAPRRKWTSDGRVRTAVIGSPRVAADLAAELEVAAISDYIVVGRIAVGEPGRVARVDEVPTLGALSNLREIVEQHNVALLVMSGEAPRFVVFDEIASSCLHLPVRLWELAGFYEDVFGHVAVADINAAWFQYLMHPNYRAIVPAAKRAIDLAVASVLAVIFLPLLVVLALAIRRDGGPVFFKQIRIGEGGRPLIIHKLRTMMAGSSVTAQWSGPDDPRVTRIGRVLRRTHLDELPQLFNVIRGDMSLVGPRPEQPQFVERLEGLVAFYQRRHLVKPGITGWAQVRCGYAGSDIGSAWKLSHDLFYIKHRSLAFDLAILVETIRTFFSDRQYAVEPPGVSFMLSNDPLANDPRGHEKLATPRPTSVTPVIQPAGD